MNAITKFDIADYRAVEIARYYYDETKKPFVVSVGRSSSWDCQSTDGTVRIEVKYETTPARTGNVCIEYWNSHLNQPSGVLATDCTLWVHVIPDGDSFIAIEYELPQLRKLVIEKGVLNTNGHDALFKLIPIEIFKQYAKRFFRFNSTFQKEISS